MEKLNHSSVWKMTERIAISIVENIKTHFYTVFENEISESFKEKIIAFIIVKVPFLP